MSALNCDESAAAESFWREALRGWTSVTRLPFSAQRPQAPDRHAPSRGRIASTSATISIGEDVLRDYEINLETLLVGALALLLNRLTGEEKVLFGVIADRSFPLVVTIGEDLSALNFLQSLEGLIARFRSRAMVSLSQIRAWSEIKSGEPFFECALVYNSAAASLVESECPLLIDVAKKGASHCALELLYDARSLATDLAERFLMQFTKLVSDIASDPHRPLGAYSALTQWETEKLLVDWNQTKAEVDQHNCIHQLFEQQVARTPSARAVIFRDEELTYAELNQRAERLASHLRDHLGVGPERVVAICMEPSVELMVALLGILKAGGAYLPVDPAFPAERITFMLRDSRAAVILTQSKLNARFDGQPARVIVVDSVLKIAEPPSKTGSGVHDSNVTDRVHSNNLAYLMFTSGSTGTPKAVMVEHRNVVNFFAGMDRVIGTERGVWLAVTSISFDISVLELLWTLTRGFTVVLQAEEDKLIAEGDHSPAAQLRRHHITHLQCTPTLARMLTRLPDTLSAMKSLRQLLLGGEPFPLALANQLCKELPAEIHNMYGPTETTVWSTTFKLSGIEPDAVPIGRPIANTTTYILDQQRRMVPVGARGELYIGGNGVTRGYWDRPELTAERFISNPFSRDPRDRLYKTGDLARYRADGTIDFLGRIDHQVKLRGFRIELGEIESVFGKHPGVQEVAISISETSTGHQQLVAYVVTAPGQRITVRELQIYARQKLPEYMIPAAVVLVDRLPMTPNGKVDRKALDGLVSTNKVHTTNDSASSTDLEATISQVWRDILGLNAIGLHDNLFDLGADSLTVAEAAVNLKEMCKVDVRLTDLFVYPTISALAKYLSRNGDTQNVARSGSERGAVRREVLLSRIRTGADRKGR